MRTFVLTVATLLVTSAVALADATPATTSTSDLSARIVLPDTTVRSGSQLNGYVEIRNPTGAEVTVSGCLSPVVVALSNRSARGGVGWLDCGGAFTIPTGRSRFSVSVRADYGGCSGEPSPTSEPVVRCGPNGEIPGLPPGTYRAKLYQRHRFVADPPPVRVRVLEASEKQTAYGASNRRSYPLLSSGWKPGLEQQDARISGLFHAALTANGACAWLGDGAIVYRWPAGYRVRFNPTELLDRDGRVVARQGDLVSFGGGGPAALEESRCGAPGQQEWLVQSDRLSIVER
jgi:hypothetical protein